MKKLFISRPLPEIVVAAARQDFDVVVRAAVEACERFYPAFQLVVWGDRKVEDAMQVAIAEAYGRA